MIIDAHAHWWPSDEYVHAREAWTTLISEILDRYYKPHGIQMSMEELAEIYFDPDGSALIKQMDEANIEKTVLLPLDWESVYGKAEKDIHKQNRKYAELAGQYPDRIIAFYSINPERESAESSFKTAVREWGMKGLKLYPPTGFYPDDPLCTPLYKICLENSLPVVFHGATSPMSETHYCHPKGFTRLALQFPELRIVLAHSGGLEWFDEAIQACKEFPNIYLDISGFQSVKEKETFCGLLKTMYDSLGSFKSVMFGTDSPLFYGVCSASRMVEYIQSADLPVNEKDNLLGKTAGNLLNLEK